MKKISIPGQERCMIKVSIGGVPYTVEYLPWKDVDHDGEASRLFGQINYLKHSIRLSSDMPKEKQQISLLHEVLHAIIQEYNIREMMNDQKEHNEYAIDHISLGMFSFLQSLGIELPYKEEQNDN